MHCLFVVNFNLFVWSPMYTPNWSLSVLLKKKYKSNKYLQSIECYGAFWGSELSDTFY